MRIPIDLGDRILYVDLEEFNLKREWYNALLIKNIGKITTLKVPYIRRKEE